MNESEYRVVSARGADAGMLYGTEDEARDDADALDEVAEREDVPHRVERRRVGPWEPLPESSED